MLHPAPAREHEIDLDLARCDEAREGVEKRLEILPRLDRADMQEIGSRDAEPREHAPRLVDRRGGEEPRSDPERHDSDRRGIARGHETPHLLGDGLRRHHDEIGAPHARAQAGAERRAPAEPVVGLGHGEKGHVVDREQMARARRDERREEGGRVQHLHVETTEPERQHRLLKRQAGGTRAKRQRDDAEARRQPRRKAVAVAAVHEENVVGVAVDRSEPADELQDIAIAAGDVTLQRGEVDRDAHGVDIRRPSTRAGTRTPTPVACARVLP